MTDDRRPRLVEGPVVREWVERGACVGSDPDVWFPGKGHDAAGPAKRICAGCPVRQECLDHAIENHELYGIWGGMVLAERRAYARGRVA